MSLSFLGIREVTTRGCSKGSRSGKTFVSSTAWSFRNRHLSPPFPQRSIPKMRFSFLWNPHDTTNPLAVMPSSSYQYNSNQHDYHSNRNSDRCSSSYYSSKGEGSRLSSSDWTRSSSSSQPPCKSQGRDRGVESKNLGHDTLIVPDLQPLRAEEHSTGPGWTYCQRGGVTSLRWLDCDNRQCRHYR